MSVFLSTNILTLGKYGKKEKKETKKGKMNEFVPMNFNELFISASDTLCGSVIDQKLKDGWSDRPPLFPDNEEEEEKVFKSRIRGGIPPALRCAIWMSSIIDACHPDQDKLISRQYRTLGKVRLLDCAWDAILHQLFSTDSDRQESIAPNLGNTDILDYWDDIDANATTASVLRVVTVKGRQALSQVLCALEFALGVDFAPLLPTLTALCLQCMSESYAFYAMREMIHYSAWYFPVTQTEHYAWCQAFATILHRLHPSTAVSMNDNGSLTPEGLNPIFKYFFVPILPMEMVMRIMDIYTYEGYKAIFRFGIALLCLFQRDVIRDVLVISSSEQWWWQVREYMYSGMCPFEVLRQKAYGFHGNAIRRRLRFPRRHILERIIQIEEEKAAKDMVFVSLETPSRPIGLIPNDSIVLGKLASHRANLSKWLTPSLRLTRLNLIFSTNIHGRTLDLFYHHVKDHKPTILLCQVLNNNAIIGAFASHAWHSSSLVYGSGECFLFRLDPDPACWKWKTDLQAVKSIDFQEEEDDESLAKDQEANHSRSLIEQFMVGRDNFISMGGNDYGGSGLRLNEDLTKGESDYAKGFDNEPLPFLRNFDVGIVEVYQFARDMDSSNVLKEQSTLQLTSD
jgi:TLD/Rab-GTPase-TBC domain